MNCHTRPGLHVLIQAKVLHECSTAVAQTITNEIFYKTNVKNPFCNYYKDILQLASKNIAKKNHYKIKKHLEIILYSYIGQDGTECCLLCGLTWGACFLMHAEACPATTPPTTRPCKTCRLSSQLAGLQLERQHGSSAPESTVLPPSGLCRLGHA